MNLVSFSGTTFLARHPRAPRLREKHSSCSFKRRGAIPPTEDCHRWNGTETSHAHLEYAKIPHRLCCHREASAC
jgi:hypothetical protein